MKIFRKIILIILMLSLITGCGGADGEVNSELSSSGIVGNGEADNGTVKTIICFGDSITYGTGAAKLSTDSYPAVLQRHLGEGYKVINAGVQGETVAAIMSRANISEISLYTDLVFAENERVATIPAKYGIFDTLKNTPVQYKSNGNGLPTKTVVINGEKYGFSNSGTEYKFTRQNAEEPLTITKGTTISFDYSEHYDSCYCAVLLMGANNLDSGTDSLLERYKQFAEGFERYIFITPFYWKDYSAKFDTEFGRNAIDIRAYYRGDAFADYGIEKDKVALHDLKTPDIVPRNFRYNASDVHLNTLGYKIMGGEVYKRGVELGYWQ